MSRIKHGFYKLSKLRYLYAQNNKIIETFNVSDMEHTIEFNFEGNKCAFTKSNPHIDFGGIDLGEPTIETPYIEW